MYDSITRYNFMQREGITLVCVQRVWGHASPDPLKLNLISAVYQTIWLSLNNTVSQS